MADEQAVAAQEAPKPVPPKIQAPQVDEEKIRLAEELRQAKAALGEVGEMVKTGKLKLADQEAPKPIEEDPSALIDRKELNQKFQQLNQTVAQAFQQTTQFQARQLRDAQIELLKGKLPHFDKHEAEIKGLLEKLDPVQAQDPNTIKQIHRIVVANHQDEIVAEREQEARRAYREELIAQGVELPEDEAQEEATEALQTSADSGRTQSAKPVARPQGGVAPSGDASASRPTLRNRAPQYAALTREEKGIAARFGMTAEEYRKYGDKNWEPDTQGSRGRHRF